MHQKGLAGVAVALAFALASCGSGGSKPLTRAEFVRQATAICKARKAAYVSAMTTHHGDVRGVLRAAVPVARASAEKLSRLHPPADGQHAYDEIMAAERRQIAAMAAGRPSAANRATMLDLARLRAQLGIAACD